MSSQSSYDMTQLDDEAHQPQRESLEQLSHDDML
jgi:hypothetical protein